MPSKSGVEFLLIWGCFLVARMPNRHGTLFSPVLLKKSLLGSSFGCVFCVLFAHFWIYISYGCSSFCVFCACFLHTSSPCSFLLRAAACRGSDFHREPHPRRTSLRNEIPHCSLSLVQLSASPSSLQYIAGWGRCPAAGVFNIYIYIYIYIVYLPLSLSLSL